MKLEVVTVKGQPMLFVTRKTPMAAIGQAMGEAFETLGAFIGRNGIAPAGPPITVYRDHAAGNVTMDVGFPVAKAALAKAAGEVKAGTTPSGKAFKAVHRGPYDRLRDTYGTMEAKEGRPVTPTFVLGGLPQRARCHAA